MWRGSNTGIIGRLKGKFGAWVREGCSRCGGSEMVWLTGWRFPGANVRTTGSVNMPRVPGALGLLAKSGGIKPGGGGREMHPYGC